MNHVDHYEIERAQVVWNPLKSFNAQVLPRFAAQVAQVVCKPLISLVPRFCPGVPQCSPHTPHTGGARLRAVRTRNERGFARLNDDLEIPGSQHSDHPQNWSQIMDLTSLRPRSDTADATLEAINRCTIAISGCVATIAQLKQDRATLLMTGKPDQLRQNGTALSDAINDAAEIRDLSDHLQERLQQQAPEQVAEVAAQRRAIETAEAASAWWTSNIGLVTDGLHKIGAAFAAFADLQLAVARTNAVAEAARATAVNVVALTPRPVA